MQIDDTLRAIVTGAASGLGAAVANTLREKGARVTGFDLGGADGILGVDVTDPAAVRDGVAQAAEAMGGIDVLVNCAGIAPGAKLVGKEGPHDPGLFAKAVAINLTGSFLTAAETAARMTRNDPRGADGERGVIVHTASVAAWEGQVGQVAYAASKAGVAGMVLPMARELARHGIRVNAVAPGLFGTPMLAGLPDEVQASLGQQVPYPPRLGRPDEFAALVSHIIENPMLNGETIRLDGAIRMAAR